MTLSLIWFVIWRIHNSAAADQSVSAAAVRESSLRELQPTPRELIINHIQDILARTTQPVKANKQNKEEHAMPNLF